MERVRFCVFCGQRPDDKTKEHVLPQWLIELTGPPKRVVNFGVNPISLKQPRFDWSSFVFPACAACNQRYSDLEGSVKDIVGRLLVGTPVAGFDYVKLLDWLDKVRIGLWLGYFLLHGNPADISPGFYIDSRIGRKDRMAAIYMIDTQNKGLNAYGAETLIFQLSPSCFSLNINSIHIFNLSWDYMCAARCGFPYPRNYVINLDQNGLAEASDFAIADKVKHPVLRRPIIKPAMHLYQAILQNPLAAANRARNTWTESSLIPGSDRHGHLVRQTDSRVEVIRDQASLLEFDEVSGYHSRPLKDIVAQTYELQLLPLEDHEYASADPIKLKERKELLKAMRQLSAKYSDSFKNLKKQNLDQLA